MALKPLAYVTVGLAAAIATAGLAAGADMVDYAIRPAPVGDLPPVMDGVFRENMLKGAAKIRLKRVKWIDITSKVVADRDVAYCRIDEQDRKMLDTLYVIDFPTKRALDRIYDLVRGRCNVRIFGRLQADGRAYAAVYNGPPPAEPVPPTVKDGASLRILVLPEHVEGGALGSAAKRYLKAQLP